MDELKLNAHNNGEFVLDQSMSEVNASLNNQYMSESDTSLNNQSMYDDLSYQIYRLVQYGVRTNLLPVNETIYTTNLLLDLFGEQEYIDSFGLRCNHVNQAEDKKQSGYKTMEEDACINRDTLHTILHNLLHIAIHRNIIQDTVTQRDLFDTRLMNCLTPRPSTIIERFWSLYQESPQVATDYYYTLSQDTDYIRRYRVAKDLKWTIDTDYGTLDITVNLSKPEKDPKDIAAERLVKKSSYPKCLLCMENVGYAGNQNHPARQNHRIIPITINDSNWGFQYSPYVYYNEHCIVFSGEHTPMSINRDTFVKLIDFVKLFPHYFVGSNADLPIVGGSILSHDHFQGGRYTFAMEVAPSIYDFNVTGYEEVQASIIKWPLSVIRLSCSNEKKLIDLASHILDCWRDYTDEEAYIYAETNQQPHNTITPIARVRDGKYELDLTLRNNITTEEHPDGLYHPHQELHHIKKENIGLIEVMGLAVLPARLKAEMERVKTHLLQDIPIGSMEDLKKHEEWIEGFRTRYPVIEESNVDEILEQEIGKVFLKVLEHAGVFKQDDRGIEYFKRFIQII